MLAWFQVSTSDHGRVVHGGLAPGAAATPELLLRLRDRARHEAKLYGIETIVIDIPWDPGALFDRVMEACDERIVAVEDSFQSVASASRLLEAFPSGIDFARLAIPGADGTIRFLSATEVQESLLLAEHAPEARA